MNNPKIYKNPISKSIPNQPRKCQKSTQFRWHIDGIRMRRESTYR